MNNTLLQSAMRTLSQRLGTVDVDNNCWIKLQYSGGQSLVFSVCLPDGRKFCLKLRKENNSSIHLERESQFLKVLKSQYFPCLIEDAASNGFIIEEWIDGIPFDIQHRSLLIRNLRNIVYDLAEVLMHFVSAKPAVIHRDIKPKNLLLRNGKVIVLDFGSAEYEGFRKSISPNRHRKLGSGKYAFQPFEQLTSEPTQDRKVDVFATASVIFAIMKGKPPFDNAQGGYAEAKANYKQKENELLRILDPLSSRLGAALFHALRVEPRDRATDLKKIVDAIGENLNL